MKTAAASGFECRNCRMISDFRWPVYDYTGFLYQGKRDGTDIQTRTYQCQHCETEQDVERSASFWILLDKNMESVTEDGATSAREGSSSRAPTRPAIRWEKEQARLEENLKELRGLAQVAAASALAGMGFVAFAGSTGGNSSRVPTAVAITTVIVTAIVVIGALAGSVPLRQTPHPSQKIPQLRRALTLRHRTFLVLVIGLAIVFALDVITAITAFS